MCRTNQDGGLDVGRADQNLRCCLDIHCWEHPSQRESWVYIYLYIYIYIYMAKASLSAYVLLKIMLQNAEKVHFLAKKKHDQIWSSLLFLPFSLFCLKMAKICCFAFQKAKKSRQKTRPPPYIYIYIYIHMYMHGYWPAVCLHRPWVNPFSGACGQEKTKHPSVNVSALLQETIPPVFSVPLVRRSSEVLVLHWS